MNTPMLAFGEGVHLLPLVLILICVAVAMFFFNTKMPWITPGWKKLINVVVAVIVVIWLMNLFGVWAYLNSVHT
jgi:hypothetical protein